jgi:uncharacterized OB-fold protein
MTRQIPYVDYLVLGDDPHLLARECATCGALFFDHRKTCASCGGGDFASRRVTGQGVVRAFTIVYRATPDVAVPYVSAVIDLDGGGTVKSNLLDVGTDPDAIPVGMRASLTTFSIGSDAEGTEAVCFGFRPA